jgi:outer membrane lipoprotein-sorting protein
MIRRTLLLSAAAMTVLAALPAAAQEPRRLTEEEIGMINQISAHNSAIRTMVGRFLQIDTQGNKIEGTFFIERPGKVLFRYNPPSYEQIVSIGRGFYVVDRREKTQYAYPQDKVPLREFLSEEINLMQSNLVAIDHSDDYLTLTLRDDTPAGIVSVDLVFDRETYDLRQWVLTEPSGAQLTFSLYDVETGVEIPRTFFSIDATFRAVDPVTGR